MADVSELAEALGPREHGAEAMAMLKEPQLPGDALLEAAGAAALADRAEDVERLSAWSLDLLVGQRTCERLVGLWGALVGS